MYKRQVITLAVGRHNVARVDGWGYIIGLRQTELTDADSPAVGLLGGVMKSQLIHTAITREISAAMPGARIVEPLGEGLDGAAALPTVSPESPLGQRIHVAQ